MDILFNTEQASKHLNCSMSTLRRIIKRREITFHRRGRLLFFKEDDLETYINSGRSIANLNLDSIKAVNNNLTKPSKSNNFIGEVKEMASKLKSKARYGYGNVYLRRKNWTIDYYVNGKRIQKSVPEAQNKQQAKLILLQEKLKSFDESQQEEKDIPIARNIGFKDFGKVYEEDYMKVTRRNFSSDISRLEILCRYFKNVDLRTITPLDIERFRASRFKRGNSKSTTNRYLQLLKRMFSLAIEECYLESSPAGKVKLFSEKDNLKVRILKEDEERELMQNSSETLRPVIFMALNTGMRRAEIFGLTWSQIEFEDKKIRVERTKSDKIRYIPMNDDLFKQMLKLKNQNGQSAFVFLNPDTGKPYKDMKTAFKRACRVSGIEGLRFHDLRHTFATRLARRGVDIETISKLLGHYSIVITQRYLHSSDEQKRNAVESLSKKGANFAPLFSTNSDQIGDTEKSVGLIS